MSVEIARHDLPGVDPLSLAQAARDGGYSENKPETAGQSGYQALMAINDRVRTVMDHAGFTLEQLIEKHLRLVFEAKETKLFPWRGSPER